MIRKNKKNTKKTVKKNNIKSNVRKKKKKIPKWRKILFTTLKVLFFVFLAACIIGAGIVFGVVSGIVNDTESIDLEQLQLQKLTSFVYDNKGNQIGMFYDGENRVISNYDIIPKNLINAVIAIEDERFLSHNGVDIQRTGAAILSFIVNAGDSDFGGSTITQQLVKNVTNDKESSWQRKIREWYRAMTLEKMISKEDIMESYLNTIYLAANSYGVETASQNYFGKTVSDLNLAECAILAATIQTPEATNPYKGEEALTRLTNRQQLVLSQMLKLGSITQEEYNEAINYELVFKKAETQIIDSNQSYFVDAVFEAVVEDLIEQKGLTREAAVTLMYSNGYQIYSTMDPEVQKAIDEAYNNDTLFYKDSDGEFMQSSMVVLDHNTGEVVGLMGGAGEKTGAREFNRATEMLRQPGSTIKPIAAYGPAFEQGKLAPGSGIDDAALPTGSYNPKNYYGYFNGYVTVREAINKSMNLPAIRALQTAGIDYAYNFASNLGLNNLVPQDKNLAFAIGGLTYGTTVLEMANAYGTFANEGIHIEPKLYTKVLDKDGKEILITETVAKKVMQESTAYLITDCLRTVVTSGTAAGIVNIGSMPVVGKTGNTNDDYDQWFVGYSPYYTVACWNGYDQNQTIGYRAGIGRYPYTSIVLFDTVLEKISVGQEIKNFEKPSNVVYAKVCRDSGLVATDACRADPRGSREITDLFVIGSIPTQTCDVHKFANICQDSGMIANEFCPNVAEKSFITRPYNLRIGTLDQIYMLPTDICNIHLTAPEPEEPEESDDPDNQDDPDDQDDPDNPDDQDDPDNPDDQDDPDNQDDPDDQDNPDEPIDIYEEN